MSRNARAGAVAFIAAAATLGAQVGVHRMVSAKMLNNFAFFVLSLTMLGFAASGAWLSRNVARWREPLGDVIAVGAACFGIGLVVATAALYPSPPVEDWASGSRAGFLLGFLSCVPLGLLYALAFAGSGLVLGALLSSPALPTRRLYALDLVGSACGAFAVVPAISHLGAERATVGAGALLLAAAALLAPPRARRAQLILAVAGATVILAVVAPDRVFRLRYARDSFLGRTQSGDARYVLEHVAWDPIARIELSRVPPPQAEGSPWPSLFGPDRGLLERFRLVITQNNNAFTYAPAWDGNPRTIRGLGETVYAAAYRASLTPRPRVLVIGVGGGMDVLTALAFDASSVVGVEVNRATLDLVQHVYADYFRALGGAPARAPRARRGPPLPGEPSRPVRRATALGSRFGQWHARRRARVLRELPLHRRSVRLVPLPALTSRHPQRDAARLAAVARRAATGWRRSSRRCAGAAWLGPPSRSWWSPIAPVSSSRCSRQRSPTPRSRCGRSRRGPPATPT